MANLYYYLDMRFPDAEGRGTLKMAINHKRKTTYETLGIRLLPEEWNKEHQQVVSRPDKKFQNVLIRKRMAEATLALQRIMLRDDFDGLTSKQIVQMIVRGTDTADTIEAADYVLPVYNEYITLAKKPNTAASYRSSLKNLIEFDGYLASLRRDKHSAIYNTSNEDLGPGIDSLRFKDINVAWLRRYQQWLTEKKGMETNGANVYLRNLRTIFNYALKNEYTNARYPFKDIDMSTTEPDKRYVPWDVFLDWLSIPMDVGRTYYRDLFMLSFYLCGIRPVDLLNVKKSQIDNGRLVYWPEKLNGKTKLSIKIEPEAWAIIRKYEGKEYLLNIMERRTDYKSFMSHWNKALRAIGHDERIPQVCGNGKTYKIVKHHGVIPYITVYYARSCFASFLYNELDVSMDVISQALGHRNGSHVTNFYVKRGEAKVDEANRSLIDLLNKELAGRHPSPAWKPA